MGGSWIEIGSRIADSRTGFRNEILNLHAEAERRIAVQLRSILFRFQPAAYRLAQSEFKYFQMMNQMMSRAKQMGKKRYNFSEDFRTANSEQKCVICDVAPMLQGKTNGKIRVLTGDAGTGKTYVAKAAMNYTEELLKMEFEKKMGQKGGDGVLERSVAIMAPTGVAANNIHGEVAYDALKVDFDAPLHGRDYFHRQDKWSGEWDRYENNPLAYGFLRTQQFHDLNSQDIGKIIYHPNNFKIEAQKSIEEKVADKNLLFFDEYSMFTEKELYHMHARVNSSRRRGVGAYVQIREDCEKNFLVQGRPAERTMEQEKNTYAAGAYYMAGEGYTTISDEKFEKKLWKLEEFRNLISKQASSDMTADERNLQTEMKEKYERMVADLSANGAACKKYAGRVGRITEIKFLRFPESNKYLVQFVDETTGKLEERSVLFSRNQIKPISAGIFVGTVVDILDARAKSVVRIIVCKRPGCRSLGDILDTTFFLNILRECGLGSR